MADPRESPPTSRLRPSEGAGVARRVLRIFGESIYIEHALPPHGDLVLGRAGDCDITIPEDSISRRHARLHVGEVVTLEDLGSANGTAVRGRMLVAGEAATIAAGDSLKLGALFATIELPPPPVTPADGIVADPDVIVADPAMHALHALLRRVANGSISVLLTGETGVGKDVV